MEGTQNKKMQPNYKYSGGLNSLNAKFNIEASSIKRLTCNYNLIQITFSNVSITIAEVM